MAASQPTILIVPGAWQPAPAYTPFSKLLNKAGFETHVVALPSTGGTALPLTGLPEDVAAIRSVLEPLVDAGKDVVMLVHSAGGVSGSAALQGLDTNTRKAAGRAGGVTRIVYMAAFMVPKDSSLMEMLGGQPLPWMVMEGDRVRAHPAMVQQVAFPDAAPADAEKWTGAMTHTAAALFVGKSAYEPWAHGVPCAYIFTKQDAALPYALQQAMAGQLGPDLLTATLDAGHCPFLSKPEQLLAAVETMAAA